LSEPENGISLIISMLEYYKKRLLGLENDKDLHYDIIEDGVKTLTKKIDNALSGITEGRSASIIKVHREVVSLALNFYLQDLQNNEDVFNKKIGKSELFSNEMLKKKEKISHVLKYYCS